MGSECVAAVGTLHQSGSLQLVLIGIALVLKVMNWGPRVTILLIGCLQGLSFRKRQDVAANLGTFGGRCL